MSEVTQPAHLEEHGEDPLAGDVDRFVHPDETRTDEQIAHDEKYAITPYGNDASDEYWREFDEYHGTVNGGEEPEAEQTEQPAEAPKPVTIIEEHPAYRGLDSQYYVTSVSGRKHHTNSSNIQKLRDEGLSDEQIGLRLDKDEDKAWVRIRANKAKLAKQYLEDGYEDVDPLAGDVDRWVPPEETQD